MNVIGDTIEIESVHRVSKVKSSAAPVRVIFKNAATRSKVMRDRSQFKAFMIGDDLPYTIRNDHKLLKKLRVDLTQQNADSTWEINYYHRCLVGAEKAIYIIHGEKIEKHLNKKELEALKSKRKPQNQNGIGGEPSSSKSTQQDSVNFFLD